MERLIKILSIVLVVFVADSFVALGSVEESSREPACSVSQSDLDAETDASGSYEITVEEFCNL